MNAPFSPLSADLLSDMGGYLKRLHTDTCPDVRARLRADIADIVKKRGPVHQDSQCEITECVALPCKQIGIQYDSQPRPFAPDRWEWIADKFARYFDCEPEEVSEAETEAGDFITVKGEIVGFVRSRLS